MNTIKFNACKFLDYDDKYRAEKNLISNFGETKIVWDRPPGNEPRLVQFCSKRGRMNGAKMCLCKKYAQCSDYEDYEHDVSLDTVNLE